MADDRTNDLTRFTTLTFDVVGTLIDFETGILNWFRPRVGGVSDRDVLERFARAEDELQRSRPTLPFTQMLPLIYPEMAQVLGLPADQALAQSFRDSIADWPAFPDSVEALAYLGEHHRMVAATNADNWALDHMSRTLGDPFDDRVTAEDVGVNKPDPQVFAYLRGRLSAVGVARADILHTAQSQYHDIVPAKRLGLATAWIERRKGRAGYGATPAPAEAAEPDFHFSSLAELAAAHRRQTS